MPIIKECSGGVLAKVMWTLAHWRMSGSAFVKVAWSNALVLMYDIETFVYGLKAYCVFTDRVRAQEKADGDWRGPIKLSQNFQNSLLELLSVNWAFAN